MNKRAAFLLIAAVGAGLDLSTKEAVFHALRDGERIDVLPGVLCWRVVWNPGIVWGLFPHGGRMLLLLSLIAIPVILLLYWRTPQPRWLFTIALGLVMAGALGNLYDRAVYARVRDFIDVYVINYPVFNIADSMICVGVGCLAWQMCFSPPPGPVAAGGEGSGQR